MADAKRKLYWTGTLTTDVRSVVDATLADPRGWHAYGFRLVPTDREADADILVTMLRNRTIREALGQDFDGFNVCEMGNPAIVMLNHENWHDPPADFAADRAPEDRRALYRAYAVNHEVGHALGIHRHSAPHDDGPCDVMYQQTRGTRTCTANPWPANQQAPLAAGQFTAVPQRRSRVMRAKMWQYLRHDEAVRAAPGPRKLPVPLWVDASAEQTTKMSQAQPAVHARPAGPLR